MAVLAENLAQRRAEARQRWDAKTGAPLYITVGMGTCGLAAGAQDTLAAIEAELERRGLRATISQVGCVGMCSYEPMMELQAATKGRMNYGGAGPEVVPEIFASYFDGAPLQNAVVVGEVVPDATVAGGHTLQSLAFVHPKEHNRIPFQEKQLRVVLSNCGLIDPESVDDYLAMDGYSALERVLPMTPEAGHRRDDAVGAARPRGRRVLHRHQMEAGPPDPALAQVRHLQRGRGGPRRVHGSLHAGRRPALAHRGDDHRGLRDRRAGGLHLLPRRVSAGDPPAGDRVGSKPGKLNLLGEHILGSDFSFDIFIKEGAGAFVCGEETALMASIQGERGQPWPRPPYPAVSGLWGQPSNVNNVKSYAYVPRIMRLGADWFARWAPRAAPAPRSSR